MSTGTIITILGIFIIGLIIFDTWKKFKDTGIHGYDALAIGATIIQRRKIC